MKTPGKETFALNGDWTAENLADLEKGLPDSPVRTLDAGNLARFDTAGALLVAKHFSGARLLHADAAQEALLDFVASVPRVPSPPEEKKPHTPYAALTGIGRSVSGALAFTHALFVFIGRMFSRLFLNILHPSHFRLAAITRHIRETGLRALPIICLLAFGISMVIFYQGATQLQKFGADIYTIDLTVISLLREMAVLTTAIMVAGRSGSAFAAEIGVMKLRSEVDALRIMGIDPVEMLVVPRLLALLITLPLLSFIADIVGLAGGGIMSFSMLGVGVPQYLARVQTVATPTMFFIGMIKAPVFAFLITVVCAYQGMSAEGSAESIGKLTTKAVVQSIFLVIMADAVFSVVFSEMGL